MSNSNYSGIPNKTNNTSNKILNMPLTPLPTAHIASSSINVEYNLCIENVVKK